MPDPWIVLASTIIAIGARISIRVNGKHARRAELIFALIMTAIGLSVFKGSL